MKQSKLKVSEVGQYVSQEYFDQHTNCYKETFPGTTSSFTIPKSLIEKVINLSPEVKGIRFMYGLADHLNPNSIRILLIPCSARSEYSVGNQAILIKQGYYDHLGEKHSTLRTCELISSFVNDIKKRDQGLNYKEITRGGFFGKKKLLEFIKDSQGDQITLHFSYKEEIIHPILEFQKENNSLFGNWAQPCPPLCKEKSETEIGEEENDDCLATAAVSKIHQHSSEKVLDLYRVFRDNKLLDMKDGAIYYELYYFISPYVSGFIDQQTNKTDLLKSIYLDKITPFHHLLTEHKYEEALAFLKETLSEWVGNYQVEMIES
ncbi:hypothetical protein [Flammeovirga sp. SJP92]|uniref:hypothetical protein n=1 Tax=Flammeovirga sp. SJP92 TaxID=1775430 RepID=UPI00078920F7|nr:hypothetical protein [Flammeovirga sp. SJP92]KXX72724.1 hypothetical protein AVL50_32290 [Flammeovirga sp. SJP92]